jgi:ammonium transporter, Amt family
VWGGGLLTATADRPGDLDFAGGTVVHLNAGIAGLVGAYVIGKRRAMAAKTSRLTICRSP